MGKPIIKLHDDRDGKDYYLEWSTVVDAPITYGMSRDETLAHYQHRYGAEGLARLEQSLPKIDSDGISAIGWTLDELMSGNRAGRGETELTKQQLIEQYCRNRRGMIL